MHNFGKLTSGQNTKGPPFGSSKDYELEYIQTEFFSKCYKIIPKSTSVHNNTSQKMPFFTGKILKNIPIFMVKNYAEFQLTPAEMAGSLGWQDSKLSTTTPHPPLQSKTEALFVAVS